MMNIDLTKFSLNELDELTTKICSERAKRREEECAELRIKLKNILDEIKEKGFDVYLDCCYCEEENLIKSDSIRIEW